MEVVKREELAMNGDAIGLILEMSDQGHKTQAITDKLNRRATKRPDGNPCYRDDRGAGQETAVTLLGGTPYAKRPPRGGPKS